MTTHREALQSLAAALPDGAVVPVPREWLLELLAGAEGPPAASADALADLTCAEVAALLGRAASTVRGWLDAGLLDGYRMRGREWRVTRAALTRFQTEESKGRVAGRGSVTKPREKATDLSAWRRVS